MNLSGILKSVGTRLHLGQTRPCSTPITSSSSDSISSSSGSSYPSSSPSTFVPSSDSPSSNRQRLGLPIPSEDEEPTPDENRLASAAARLSKKSDNPYQQIIDQILRKVSELEHTLFEDQQQEFKLRMALERQTERVQELAFSLDTEKQRNGRLVQLLRGVDTSGGEDSDPEERVTRRSPVSSVGDLYESISPLLMQQRYDELSVSHRQSCRQLAKKDKALKILKCETEELHSKYDQLFDEYRSEQRRFEMLCSRYMETQLKKKQQIFNLKNTLGHASECIYHAQVAIDECCQRCEFPPICKKNLDNFNRNLGVFMSALRNCCCLRKVHELQQQQQQKQQLLQKEQPPLQSEEIQYTLIPSDERSSASQHSLKRRHRSRKRHKHLNS